MSAFIYRIANQVNGKFYIGQTTKSLAERWKQHCSASRCGSTCYFHNAIRKHGSDAFVIELLEQTSLEFLDDRERHWISTLRPVYNMTDGGEGGIPSAETRAKMSAARRGKVFSTDTRAKISVANSKRVLSKETREKIRIANQKRIISPESREKMRESGRRSSAMRRGRPLSPEHRAKLSAARRRHSTPLPECST